MILIEIILIQKHTSTVTVKRTDLQSSVLNHACLGDR